MPNAVPSLASADAFHDPRMNPLWEAAEDEEKTAALLRAFDYVQAYYNERWKDDLEDDDATYMQGIILVAPDFLTSTSMVEAAPVLKTSLSAEGVGSKSVEYAHASSDRFPQLTRYYRAIITNTGANGTIRLVL